MPPPATDSDSKLLKVPRSKKRIVDPLKEETTSLCDGCWACVLNDYSDEDVEDDIRDVQDALIERVNSKKADKQDSLRIDSLESDLGNLILLVNFGSLRNMSADALSNIGLSQTLSNIDDSTRHGSMSAQEYLSESASETVPSDDFEDFEDMRDDQDAQSRVDSLHVERDIEKVVGDGTEEGRSKNSSSPSNPDSSLNLSIDRPLSKTMSGSLEEGRATPNSNPVSPTNDMPGSLEEGRPTTNSNPVSPTGSVDRTLSKTMSGSLEEGRLTTNGNAVSQTGSMDRPLSKTMSGSLEEGPPTTKSDPISPTGSVDLIVDRHTDQFMPESFEVEDQETANCDVAHGDQTEKNAKMDDQQHDNDLVETPPLPDKSDILLRIQLNEFQNTSDESIIPISLRSDKEFMLEACSISPDMLKVASEELRDDREVVSGAILKRPLSLQYASARLKDDKELFLSLLQEQEGWSEDVFRAFCEVIDQDSPLRKDRDIALSLIYCGKPTWDSSDLLLTYGEPTWEYRDILLEFSEEIRADRELIEKAVALEGFMLEDASKSLRGDKGIVLTACRSDGRALKFASDELRADEEVVRVAVNSHTDALNYVTDRCLYDKYCSTADFVSKCNQEAAEVCELPPPAMEDDEVLIHANDEDMILEALSEGCSFDHIFLEDTKSDKEFFIKALAINPLIYDNLRRKKRCDAEIVKAALLGGYLVSQNPLYKDDVVNRFPEVLDDPEVFLWMAEHRDEHEYYVRSSLPDAMRGDKELMRKACSHDGLLLQYAHDDIRDDPYVYQAAIANNHEAILFLSDAFLCSQVDVVLDYLEHVEEHPVQFSSEVLASNRRILLEYAKKAGSLRDGLEDYTDDPEVVSWVVTRHPHELENASERLRNNREFLLPVMRWSGMSFEWVSDEMKADLDIRVAAVGSSSSVVQYLEEEFSEAEVTKLAEFVRQRLSLYNNFNKEILCSIDIVRKEEKSATFLNHLSEEPLMNMFFGSFDIQKRCALSLLRVGGEKGVVLKSTIAAFLGVPRGQELLDLKKCTRNLEKCGY